MDTTQVQIIWDDLEAVKEKKTDLASEIDALIMASATPYVMPKAYSGLSLQMEWCDYVEVRLTAGIGQAVLDACQQAKDRAAEDWASLEHGALKEAYARRDALLIEIRKGSDYKDTRTPAEITALADQSAEVAILRGTITNLEREREVMKRCYTEARQAHETYSILVSQGRHLKAARLFLDGGIDKEAMAKRLAERQAIAAAKRSGRM